MDEIENMQSPPSNDRLYGEALEKSMKLSDGKLNEPAFADFIVDKYNLVTCHGVMRNTDGTVDESMIKKDISHKLESLGYQTYTMQKVESVFKLCKIRSAVPEIKTTENQIPLQNGTIVVDLSTGGMTFDSQKYPSPYRLNVILNSDKHDYEIPKAKRFFEWLEIFEPEDIPCFQEIMGYLLIPTTMGQKSFFLLGSGREGKSVFGSILYMLFGNAFTPVKVYELEDNRFTIATLEGKLIAYDDDMNHEKLKKTDNFKTLVTAKVPQQGERKGQDKFEFKPYARLCGCGNFLPSSLYDTSEGFFRRLLPIRVRNRSADRKDIPDFEKPMQDELEAILRWSLVGLKRLIKNNFQFSVSQRSENLLQDIREDGNSILDFTSEKIVFDKNAVITSEDLYRSYKLYCDGSGAIARSRNTFLNYYKERNEALGIQYSKHASGDKRGFIGMRIGQINLDEVLGGNET